MAHVSIGDPIENEIYNGLRSDTSAIYVSLWGQSMRSSDVIGGSTLGVSDTVTAEQHRLLYLDVQAVRVHQSGSVSASVVRPLAGYVIGADQSTGYNQTTGADIAVTGGTLMGINDYETVVTTNSNYTPTHNGWPSGNFVNSTSVSSSRTGTWGAATPTIIYHAITYQWTSNAAKNYWLNAGGQITFTASASNIGTGASQSKNQDWADLLSALGVCRFDKLGASAASGTGGTIGMQNLTSTYQTIWQKNGSGFYDDNYWRLEARNVDNRTVKILISMNDGDTGTGDQGGPGTGTPIDEPVTADITSTAISLSPDSSFTYESVTYDACVLPAPSQTQNTSLATNLTSKPS